MENEKFISSLVHVPEGVYAVLKMDALRKKQTISNYIVALMTDKAQRIIEKEQE